MLSVNRYSFGPQKNVIATALKIINFRQISNLMITKNLNDWHQIKGERNSQRMARLQRLKNHHR